GRGYFSHAGGWYELVNKETNGVVGTGTETYNLGTLSVTGNVSIGGTLTYEDVKNVDAVGLITARSGIRVTGGVIEAQAGENKIPSLYSNMGALPSAGSYHGMFAHVHSTGRGYFAHAGNWLELVNKEINGVVGTGTERYNIGPVDLTTLDVSGISTFAGNIDANANIDLAGDLDVDGHTNLDNVDIAGITTMRGNLTIANTLPYFFLNDTDDSKTWAIANHNGGFYIRDYTVGADRFYIDGNGKVKVIFDFDVNGHTDLDNVSIAGVTTIAQDLDVDGHTNLDNVSIAGVTTFAGNIDANANIDLAGDLDVDGHTNL
ncbi:MAG: hypothetical protein VXY93_12905, partial [Pseudomonadota bacterium]|nr:hypothetical protein [Pseudomonadota bacterium]